MVATLAPDSFLLTAGILRREKEREADADADADAAETGAQYQFDFLKLESFLQSVSQQLSQHHAALQSTVSEKMYRDEIQQRLNLQRTVDGSVLDINLLKDVLYRETDPQQLLVKRHEEREEDEQSMPCTPMNSAKITTANKDNAYSRSNNYNNNNNAHNSYNHTGKRESDALMRRYQDNEVRLLRGEIENLKMTIRRMELHHAEELEIFGRLKRNEQAHRSLEKEFHAYRDADHAASVRDELHTMRDEIFQRITAETEAVGHEMLVLSTVVNNVEVIMRDNLTEQVSQVEERVAQLEAEIFAEDEHDDDGFDERDEDMPEELTHREEESKSVRESPSKRETDRERETEKERASVSTKSLSSQAQSQSQIQTQLMSRSQSIRAPNLGRKQNSRLEVFSSNSNIDNNINLGGMNSATSSKKHVSIATFADTHTHKASSSRALTRAASTLPLIEKGDDSVVEENRSNVPPLTHTITHNLTHALSRTHSLSRANSSSVVPLHALSPSRRASSRHLLHRTPSLSLSVLENKFADAETVRVLTLSVESIERSLARLSDKIQDAALRRLNALNNKLIAQRERLAKNKALTCLRKRMEECRTRERTHKEALLTRSFSHLTRLSLYIQARKMVKRWRRAAKLLSVRERLRPWLRNIARRWMQRVNPNLAVYLDRWKKFALYAFHRQTASGDDEEELHALPAAVLALTGEGITSQTSFSLPLETLKQISLQDMKPRYSFLARQSKERDSHRNVTRQLESFRQQQAMDEKMRNNHVFSRLEKVEESLSTAKQDVRKALASVEDEKKKLSAQTETQLQTLSQTLSQWKNQVTARFSAIKEEVATEGEKVVIAIAKEFLTQSLQSLRDEVRKLSDSQRETSEVSLPAIVSHTNTLREELASTQETLLVLRHQLTRTHAEIETNGARLVQSLSLCEEQREKLSELRVFYDQEIDWLKTILKESARSATELRAHFESFKRDTETRIDAMLNEEADDIGFLEDGSLSPRFDVLLQSLQSIFGQLESWWDALFASSALLELLCFSKQFTESKPRDKEREKERDQWERLQRSLSHSLSKIARRVAHILAMKSERVVLVAHIHASMLRVNPQGIGTPPNHAFLCLDPSVELTIVDPWGCRHGCVCAEDAVRRLYLLIVRALLRERLGLQSEQERERPCSPLSHSLSPAKSTTATVTETNTDREGHTTVSVRVVGSGERGRGENRERAQRREMFVAQFIRLVEAALITQPMLALTHSAHTAHPTQTPHRRPASASALSHSHSTPGRPSPNSPPPQQRRHSSTPLNVRTQCVVERAVIDSLARVSEDNGEDSSHLYTCSECSFPASIEEVITHEKQPRRKEKFTEYRQRHQEQDREFCRDEEKEKESQPLFRQFNDEEQDSDYEKMNDKNSRNNDNNDNNFRNINRNTVTDTGKSGKELAARNNEDLAPISSSAKLSASMRPLRPQSASLRNVTNTNTAVSATALSMPSLHIDPPLTAPVTNSGTLSAKLSATNSPFAYSLPTPLSLTDALARQYPKDVSIRARHHETLAAQKLQTNAVGLVSSRRLYGQSKQKQ